MNDDEEVVGRFVDFVKEGFCRKGFLMNALFALSSLGWRPGMDKMPLRQKKISRALSMTILLLFYSIFCSSMRPTCCMILYVLWECRETLSQ